MKTKEGKFTREEKKIIEKKLAKLDVSKKGERDRFIKKTVNKIMQKREDKEIQDFIKFMQEYNKEKRRKK